jgi:hypothetical protein
MGRETYRVAERRQKRFQKAKRHTDRQRDVQTDGETEGTRLQAEGTCRQAERRADWQRIQYGQTGSDTCRQAVILTDRQRYLQIGSDTCRQACSDTYTQAKILADRQ